MNEKEDPEYEINTLANFIEVINALSDSAASPPTLFRGQRDAAWPLLPKLARLHNQKKLKDTFRATEKTLMIEFKRQAHIFGAQMLSEWDWLCLAQHHGMATRLLDWSENPLLALWFAIRKPAENTNNAVVWVFKPKANSYINIETQTGPQDLRNTKVLVPDHSNPRIKAQSGRFTAHYFKEDENHFVALERNRNFVDCLEKILISPANFCQIRSDLDRCGVNDSVMFPDLDGLARHIEWQYTRLDDEMDDDTEGAL